MTFEKRTLMHRPLLVAATAIVGLVAPAPAQTVLRTAKSKIEIIGLQRWTLKMIEDSLAKYAPGEDLTVHACAQILQQKLRFPSAAVTNFIGFGDATDNKTYVAITVVEPQDSAKIHFKPALFDTLMAHAKWPEASEAFRKNPDLSQQAFQTPSFFAARWSAQDSAKFAKIEPIHRLIMSRRSPADFETAMRMLDGDSNTYNRTMAALIVANFGDRDAAWHALVDAQRDPIGAPGSTAQLMLHSLLERAPRTVDWKPAMQTLRYILDGTNLFVFDGTLDILTATKIDRSLAPQLLAGGGTVLRAKLRSGNTFSKKSVSAFLAHMSGLPEDSDAATFERWMSNLSATVSR